MPPLEPNMTPGPGSRLQRFVGDRLRFELQPPGPEALPQGWQARLRTNLGRAEVLRREILQAHTEGLSLAGASWRDLPMEPAGQGWRLDLPLAEAGYFKAKAYLLDPRGWQHWPSGPDVGISVHPDRCRTANLLYCAFPRLFGEGRTALQSSEESLNPTLAPLDAAAYTIIPPSGKLRDLTCQLPHIFDCLGCRILHLLPINPTPTTYARFGRFGSPYAALDLTAIDPALVVFDKRFTGVDQFRELTYATHLRGGRLFLDIVINHTGWGSVLQETHPEWFKRQPDGTFVSPGAWDVTWEDLVELRHRNVQLWDELAQVFLTWCRRGVDGFRCDAGYMVPVPAWQYIVARVQQEYPEVVLFLEGLGGSWEATDALLTEGGMQWAYSELFQNYSGPEVARYLDHSFRQSQSVGLLVHYSETHDNPRLAARGRDWSLLRNRLCALASVRGGFGFTCGVEWLATEKIRVHGCTGLAWDNPENLLPALARLNLLLAEHPCFFDGARLTRLSPEDSPVYALQRDSQEGKDTLLVLVNTDPEHSRSLGLQPNALQMLEHTGNGSGPCDQPEVPGPQGAAALPNPPVLKWVDLLDQPAPRIKSGPQGALLFELAPGAVHCLAPTPLPRGLHGEAYRRARAQAAWAFQALSAVLPLEHLGKLDWQALAVTVDFAPSAFLAAITQSTPAQALARLQELLARPEACPPPTSLPRVVCWSLLDLHRVTPVPPGHWLLLQDKVPFRVALDLQDGSPIQNLESVPVREGHVACFAPRQLPAKGSLLLERYADTERHLQATVRFLPLEPVLSAGLPQASDLVLLTNGRGGMARLCVDLGRVTSKYDCVLGANLHPSLPVDRHILVKRIRVWLNADGFISPLDFRCLTAFEPGPPATWSFVANAGDGRSVQVQMSANMLPGRNTTLFRFSRPSAATATGKQLPAEADVRLTVRLDLEDRNFHWETHRNGGAEYHFSTHLHPVERGSGSQPRPGFTFTPAPDRQLRAFSDSGQYHPQPEWSENLPHTVEQSRGQAGSGDAFSPGWFELPLPKGAIATLVVTADPTDPTLRELNQALSQPPAHRPTAPSAESDPFGQQLLRAIRAFVVQRGAGKTVIAGYPWFLDWGRDTFICARGLLAAGLTEEVHQILLTFARFEKDGTLPNTIFGEDASNRDTTDAPLWFALVHEELSQIIGPIPSVSPISLPEVLQSIASHYVQGTPNAIRMDPASALIWSPAHFTWMDTNYPAGTPRQGYPVEIQALWIRLLRRLQRLGAPAQRRHWAELADRALASFEQLFWKEERGYYADVLLAGPGQPAAQALADDALRSNCFIPIALGVVSGARARRCVAVSSRYLVVPGALRSLAPLPVTVPLPVNRPDGSALNDPFHPYWGRYEGDEDTRRKPAYHNGTAWTWTFPIFCEALARAWDFSPEALATARAYLASMAPLLQQGCLGQLPEILDGDAPHLQRGCDAQAWAATEALRVWKLLQSPPSHY